MKNIFESIKIVPNRSFGMYKNGSKKRIKIWLFHVESQVVSGSTAETEVNGHVT